MHVSEAPPRNWDSEITSPLVSRAFADAAAACGHRPLYIAAGAAKALALVRTFPIPLVRSWTRRAQVYVSRGDTGFVRGMVATLKARGIAQARVEDSVEGIPSEALEQAGITPVVSYRITNSLLETERELFRRLTPRRRRALRRGRHEGITVSEISAAAELQQYVSLAGRTERPGGPYDAGGAMSGFFIRAIFGTLAPSRQAVFLLARRGDAPIAGAIFFASPDRMTLFHTVTASEPELAVSGWDPDLADFQGPTAVTWHAMGVARARGIPRFDLGQVTPVPRRNDRHFLAEHFKRSFGGQLEPTYSGEVTLLRLRQAFQEMLPDWNGAAERYMTPFDARRAASAAVLERAQLGRPVVSKSSGTAAPPFNARRSA